MLGIIGNYLLGIGEFSQFLTNISTKGAVPGVFGLHNMRRGGLRFRKNSLTPRNSLTSLRTAQGLVCDAGDVL